MPRIPVRLTPYSSPMRAHRHFKSKRDHILRQLGKAAYINGSHFALLIVSGRGEVETYASDALQTSINEWFNQQVLEQARAAVMAEQKRRKELRAKDADAASPDESGPGNESLDEPASPSDDLFDVDGFMFDPSGPSSGESASSKGGQQHNYRVMERAWSPTPVKRRCEPSTPLEKRLHSINEMEALHSPMMQSSPATMSFATSGVPQTPGDLCSIEVQPYIIHLADSCAIDQFLIDAFERLQQHTCKLVAKSWIKIIEPKKQTRYPYNKGEAAKPEWWPLEVRHKEPDHLMKPERVQLLLNMLRTPRSSVARLELATAEVAAFIPSSKIPVLRDIYRVAREDERLRNGDIAPGKGVHVAVSTTSDTRYQSNSFENNTPVSAGFPSQDIKSEEESNSDMSRTRSNTSNATAKFDSPALEPSKLQRSHSLSSVSLDPMVTPKSRKTGSISRTMPRKKPPLVQNDANQEMMRTFIDNPALSLQFPELYQQVMASTSAAMQAPALLNQCDVSLCGVTFDEHGNHTRVQTTGLPGQRPMRQFAHRPAMSYDAHYFTPMTHLGSPRLPFQFPAKSQPLRPLETTDALMNTAFQTPVSLDSMPMWGAVEDSHTLPTTTNGHSQDTDPMLQMQAIAHLQGLGISVEELGMANYQSLLQQNHA